MDPEGALWGLREHLLASLLDQIRMDAWAAGGGKGPRPKQTPRPGVSSKAKMRVGDAMTTDEFDRRMAEKMRRSRA